MRSSNPAAGSPESPANSDDSEPDVVPMAPIDLARGYATLAFEVNHALKIQLPKLEAELRETRGIARDAHAMIAEIRARVEDIAVAVGVGHAQQSRGFLSRFRRFMGGI